MAPRHAKRFLATAAVLALAIGLLVLRFGAPLKSTVSDFFSPYLEARQEVEWRARESSQFAKSKVELIQEIEELKAQVESQSFAEQRLEALRQENHALRQQLDLQAPPDYQLITARVLISDPATGGRTFMIDRGQRDGLWVGQPVLRGGSLVGRINAVASDTAQVLSISDPSCKVSVRIAETQLHGILVGRGSNAWRARPYCIARYMPRDTTYEAGMLLETSAYDPLVPPGLPIGTLTRRPERELVVNVDNLYKTLTVEPFAFSVESPYVTVVLELKAPPLSSTRP